MEDLTGRIEGPAEDVSAGRWRERLIPAGSPKPPAHLQPERRKYLVRAAGAQPRRHAMAPSSARALMASTIPTQRR